MSNNYKPHILVIPEDDANREIANGFQLSIDFGSQRQFQIMPVCGGWLKVVDRFIEEYLPGLTKYPNRNIVLMIDFDGKEDRFASVRSSIPDEVADRVFIIGSQNEPEKIGLGSKEKVGQLLAKDCREQATSTWEHDAFKHNLGELFRIREKVCHIIF